MPDSIHSPPFPERFLRYATREFGKEGEAWLEELPSILRRCCDKWGLTPGRPAGDIKANYIAWVELDNGEEAVLKVGVPHDDFSAEMEALAIYQGRGINRLIDCDKELNAMLLERLRPGRTLPSQDPPLPDRCVRSKATLGCPGSRRGNPRRACLVGYRRTCACSRCKSRLWRRCRRPGPRLSPAPGAR